MRQVQIDTAAEQGLGIGIETPVPPVEPGPNNPEWRIRGLSSIRRSLQEAAGHGRPGGLVLAANQEGARRLSSDRAWASFHRTAGSVRQRGLHCRNRGPATPGKRCPARGFVFSHHPPGDALPSRVSPGLPATALPASGKITLYLADVRNRRFRCCGQSVLQVRSIVHILNQSFRQPCSHGDTQKRSCDFPGAPGVLISSRIRGRAESPCRPVVT